MKRKFTNLTRWREKLGKTAGTRSGRICRIKEAQFDGSGVRGEQREIHADAGPRRPERIGLAGPDSHTGRVTRDVPR